MEAVAGLPDWAQNLFAAVLAIGAAYLVLRGYFRGKQDALPPSARSTMLYGIGGMVADQHAVDRHATALERIAAALEAMADERAASRDRKIDEMLKYDKERDKQIADLLSRLPK